MVKFRIDTTWNGISINVITESSVKAQQLMDRLSDLKKDYTVGISNEPANDSDTIMQLICGNK